jgi:hypothetical protein
MKRSTTVFLAAGIIASSSFAYHVTSASCWDQYNLSGTTKVSTLVSTGVAPKDCTPGTGCWYGYRASDGKRNSWFVPYRAKPSVACGSPAAPTTAAPATAAPAPTVAPTTAAPAPPTGQFVETFTGNTGLDRFNTGIYHRDESATGMVSNTTWTGDHDMNCGSPDTQRLIHRDAKNESFYMCKDHLMTSIGDTAGYSTGWFTPKQTFSSGTRVSWDVNLTDLGGRQWWEVSIVPASFDSGVPTCPHCSVQGFLSPSPSGLPPYPAGSVVVGNGPLGRDLNVSTNGINRNVAQYYSVCNFDPAACASKSLRRSFSITDNRNGTVTVNYGGFATYTVPGSFPAGGFNVVFKDHNYTPDKDGVPVGHTWHWDNIVIQ